MPSLHLFLHLAAKEARGLEQQHDDEDGERDSVLPGRQADGGNEALAQADDDAADHCARDGANAAQNGSDEGFQAQHGAHGGSGLRVGAAVQHRADAGQCRADREGKGDGAVDVDAHQAGSVHILRDGAHGLAKLGLLDEEGQHQHGQHGDHQRDDGGQAQRHFAQIEGLVVVVRRDDLCARAHDQLSRVLEEERHADGCDEQRDTGCAAQRGVGNLFDDHAQQRTGEDGGTDRRDRAEAQLVHDEPGHVRAHHDDVAMGKVQQQDDAVHHAVAQCDQCIDAAKGQAIDQLAEKHCHGWILPFFPALLHALCGDTLFYQKSGDHRGNTVPAFSAVGSIYDHSDLSGASITGRWKKAGIRTFPSAPACRPHRSG